MQLLVRVLYRSLSNVVTRYQRASIPLTGVVDSTLRQPTHLDPRRSLRHAFRTANDSSALNVQGLCFSEDRHDTRPTHKQKPSASAPCCRPSSTCYVELSMIHALPLHAGLKACRCEKSNLTENAAPTTRHLSSLISTAMMLFMRPAHCSTQQCSHHCSPPCQMCTSWTRTSLQGP